MFKSYDWDCDDPDKCINVPHREKGLIPHGKWDNAIRHPKRPNHNYPKAASDVTNGELAEAITKAVEEAGCDGEN